MLVRVLAVAGFCWGAACHAAALHVDDFAGSLQGWTGGAAPAYVASGGPAGAGDGFLRISSSGNNLAAFNIQSAWIGDYAAAGAVRVEADLMSPTTSASAVAARLVLFGPATTLDRWTSAAGAFVPNDGVWRRYTFGLGESDLVQVQGTGTHAELMASVLRVMLRHNPGDPSAEGTPIIGVLNIDNVRLVGVPEPGSAHLAAWGVGAMASALTRGARRRRPTVLQA